MYIIHFFKGVLRYTYIYILYQIYKMSIPTVPVKVRSIEKGQSSPFGMAFLYVDIKQPKRKKLTVDGSER